MVWFGGKKFMWETAWNPFLTVWECVSLVFLCYSINGDDSWQVLLICYKSEKLSSTTHNYKHTNKPKYNIKNTKVKPSKLSVDLRRIEIFIRPPCPPFILFSDNCNNNELYLCVCVSIHLFLCAFTVCALKKNKQKKPQSEWKRRNIAKSFYTWLQWKSWCIDKVKCFKCLLKPSLRWRDLRWMQTRTSDLCGTIGRLSKINGIIQSCFLQCFPLFEVLLELLRPLLLPQFNGTRLEH